MSDSVSLDPAEVTTSLRAVLAAVDAAADGGQRAPAGTIPGGAKPPGCAAWDLSGCVTAAIDQFLHGLVADLTPPDHDARPR